MHANTTPQLILIAAVAQNGVIGINNTLPWRLPADLKYFKQCTDGQTLIMGRKTFDSLGRLLPNRRHIVITRNTGWQAEGVTVAHSLAEAIQAAGAVDKVFVIGGAEIYAAALPIADALFLTEVDANPEGDAFFPPFDRSGWAIAWQAAGQDNTELRYRFVQYRRAN